MKTVERVCEICGEFFKNEEDDFSIYLLCPKCYDDLQVFWDECKSRCGKADPRDMNLTDFIVKHRNVIKLAEGKENYHDRNVIAHILMGDYYLNGFSSRGASGYLANIFGCGDYMTLYCGSSTYADIRFFTRYSRTKIINENIKRLLEEYEEADKKDRD